jgi:hypothetical protein
VAGAQDKVALGYGADAPCLSIGGFTLDQLNGQRFALTPKMIVAAWRDGATPIIDLADHLFR